MVDKDDWNDRKLVKTLHKRAEELLSIHQSYYQYKLLYKLQDRPALESPRVSLCLQSKQSHPWEMILV